MGSPSLQRIAIASPAQLALTAEGRDTMVKRFKFPGGGGGSTSKGQEMAGQSEDRMSDFFGNDLSAPQTVLKKEST